MSHNSLGIQSNMRSRSPVRPISFDGTQLPTEGIGCSGY